MVRSETWTERVLRGLGCFSVCCTGVHFVNMVWILLVNTWAPQRGIWGKCMIRTIDRVPCGNTRKACIVIALTVVFDMWISWQRKTRHLLTLNGYRQSDLFLIWLTMRLRRNYAVFRRGYLREESLGHRLVLDTFTYWEFTNCVNCED